MAVTEAFYQKKSNQGIFYKEDFNIFEPMKKSSSVLLSDIDCIFERKHDTEYVVIDNCIDKWEADAQEWKMSGFFSGVSEDMDTFVNKKSIVVDDSVFLISVSTDKNSKCFYNIL